MFGWLPRARERWHRGPFEPLQIRAWLASPIAWDGRDAVTIDGPLQFAVVLRETGRLPDDVFAELPSSAPKVDIPIPVADVAIGGWLIACASWGRPAGCAVESMRFRRKRARAEHYAIERLGIAGGWGKSLNLPVATLTTPFLDFHVMGNRTLLEELLLELGGLGRDHTCGFGSVLGYEITREPADRSILWEGAPQRSIPLAFEGRFARGQLASGTWEDRVVGTRAPYWHQATRTRCAVPSIRIGAEA